jgi:hypothetical protein
MITKQQLENAAKLARVKFEMGGGGMPLDSYITHYYRQSTAMKKKGRRANRKHAERMLKAGCPERAAVWFRRARNG